MRVKLKSDRGKGSIMTELTQEEQEILSKAAKINQKIFDARQRKEAEAKAQRQRPNGDARKKKRVRPKKLNLRPSLTLSESSSRGW